MNDKLLVLRTIYENKNLSQRDISDILSISLGKSNSIINQLIKKNYIIKDKNYKITVEGKKELEKYKVDLAVILACGMGVRLAPLSYEMPKSFLKINNKPLIERQIEQLLNAGIKNIYIMVGYLKESFDYLIDKYKVKLIYNEEYQEKNTLATLMHAKDIIKNKNCYICVSDVYIKDNIYHKYEFEPYYSAVFLEDVKNEWQFITNSKNEILKIKEGGKNGYCMIGPAYFTKQFSNKFLPIATKYYNKNDTMDFYWEDVLVRNFKNLPKMFAYKKQKNSIVEFDTIKDLTNFDNKFNNTGSSVLSFISKNLKCNESDIINIERIKNGMTNRTCKFQVKNDDNFYIIRIPGENTNKFINRKNEYEIYQNIKDYNITEDLLAFDKNTGYKISKYIKNAKLVNVNNISELKNTMKLYKQFHNLNIKVKPTASLKKMINSYLNIIQKKNIDVLYVDFADSIKKVKQIFKLIDKYDRIEVLTHGDPNPQNVLITKEGYKLIDFEYAGMADPLCDISLFATYVDFDIEKSFKLLEYYLESVGSNEIILYNCDENSLKNLFVCYMTLGSFYDCLWAICRSALSNTDYGYFNMKKYRNFKMFYEYLKENNKI